MRAGLIQAVCTSVGPVKKNAAKQRNRDNWYGRPESLLAQTFAETLKISNETNYFFFFFFKNTQKDSQKTLEIPSMVANSVVGGNPSYGLSI
jgi:hypothetical protein